MRHFPSRLLLFFLVFHAGSSLKFLAFSPQFAVSHVNFIGKISDALIEAGHEVVIVAPLVDPGISGGGSKKARVIELPSNEHCRNWNAVQVRTMDMYWNGSFLAIAMETEELFESIARCSNATFHYPGLIEKLRAEKFDAAFSEDPAGFGLFHLAGISKHAIAVSFTAVDCNFVLTQMPTNPSYVPAILSPFGDQMSFFQRVANTLMSFAFGFIMQNKRINPIEPYFNAIQPGLPTIRSIMSNSSLVFLNSEPLLDFPRPTVHRVIDIGGIVTPIKFQPLDEYWSSILSLRPHTIFFSFGTYIKASAMPEEYKTTIRETMAKFPNVTFIWKYEDSSHNVSGCVENIVETKWIPQVDMLNDPRLTAFVTHGGQGSTLEAAYAGVPMLMVPTQGDQYRNAAMIKRAGLGDIVYLSSLEGENDELERAIREMLENPKYKYAATRAAAMLRDRPFSAREKLVRNLEFLASYGPLRMLDHEGRNMNFVQYYLIDVFLFLGFVSLVVLGLVILCLAGCCKCCCSCCSAARQRYVMLKQEQKDESDIVDSRNGADKEA